MRETKEIIEHPVIVEVVHSTPNTTVALFEGCLYVKNDGEYMHPVMIPVGTDMVRLNDGNIRRMTVQRHEGSGDVKIRYTLPEQQFDMALEDAVPYFEDDEPTSRGAEYYDIWEKCYNIFENALDEAQASAMAVLLQIELEMVHAEIHRVKDGECTREEFLDWISRRVNALDEEDIEILINHELGKENDAN